VINPFLQLLGGGLLTMLKWHGGSWPLQRDIGAKGAKE
jgi:hypothetical protein